MKNCIIIVSLLYSLFASCSQINMQQKFDYTMKKKEEEIKPNRLNDHTTIFRTTITLKNNRNKHSIQYYVHNQYANGSCPQNVGQGFYYEKCKSAQERKNLFEMLGKASSKFLNGNKNGNIFHFNETDLQSPVLKALCSINKIN